jgi:hypothetical protein
MPFFRETKEKANYFFSEAILGGFVGEFQVV